MYNRIIAITLLSICLAACGSDPEKPKPEAPAPAAPPAPEAKQEEPKKITAIDAQIVVSKKVNPNIEGQPSPVVMRFFELKNLGKFESGDFYKLAQNHEAQLGSDLIASEQFHLHPGQTKIIKHEITKETAYIAVTVAYRDINKAVWRASLAMEPDKTNTFDIFVDKLKVEIKPQP
jgi:type VI secretion system protein VasD